MELTVQCLDKDLVFRYEGKTGRGLDKLIKFTGKNKHKISKINIECQTDSYTSLRQMYLFSNLIVVLSDIEVVINGMTITEKNPIFPTYK